MINIGIIDRHPVTRAGLRRLFADHVDLRVVGEASTPATATSLFELAGLQVLLMDLPLSGQFGLDAVGAVHEKVPNTGILVLTRHAAEHYAIPLIRQGARGYLNKDCDMDHIVDAVRTVALGQRYFSAEVADLLAHQLDHKNPGAGHEKFSRRETEVFYKLARGESAIGIASELALSVKSVSTYRTRLLEKLNLSSNSDLTYYAFNHRLIS